MLSKSNNREILVALTKRYEFSTNVATFDSSGNILDLDLSSVGLTTFPLEIVQLTNLQMLNLSKNKLSQLPPEICWLTNLTDLNLHSNNLSELPAELWSLSSLSTLNLGGNNLISIPPSVQLLSNLTNLLLWGNELQSLPLELWQIDGLVRLNFHTNPLSQLPPGIEQLVNLEPLYISGNQTKQFMIALSHLPQLKELVITFNDLIFKEKFSKNYAKNEFQLDRLPPELGQLTNLQRLDLSTNQLSQLPPELGQLTNLQRLVLSTNQLSQLPPELGQLTNLQTLDLTNNPNLLTPPPEIVAHGVASILEFLSELQTESITRFEAKLLVVGEGGTGKSSLLRSLRNEAFEIDLPTTHGIELGNLCLTLSNQSQFIHEVTLNTWDFGGQHIYHATHQFFLTKRSLYMILWNARLGADQGNLKYWLEIIQALAPSAPVLLVATHIDERPSDLNYQLYKDAYPQLRGSLAISNQDRRGIEDLKYMLYQLAIELPFIGQPWPKTWLKVEQAILKRQEHHINIETYVRLSKVRRVKTEIAKGSLGSYLHDLGKILYFRDDYILNMLVILKPNWITKAISCVLEDEITSIQNRGILLHSDLPRIWSTDDEGHSYDPELYPVFLRLMERFDLSYQIESDTLGKISTKSLIPQLLPHQPPPDLPLWVKQPTNSIGLTQVEIVYRFDFIPPGILSWFIVRTHRYTKNTHWRDGVLLEYQDHEAKVELNPILRELRLQVRGIQPHNFIVILKYTVDLILSRFEGLNYQCEVPCICHKQRTQDRACSRYYRYDDLDRLMKARIRSIRCMDSLYEVSVPEMLYGIHMSTDEQVMADIRKGQQQIYSKLNSLDQTQRLDILVEQVNQLSELLRHNFTRQWNQIELPCPNLFFLTTGSSTFFNPLNWVSEEYRLYLLCQHLPHPHAVGSGYSLREAADWWKAVAPWLNHLVKFLKFAVPMSKALEGVYDAVDMKTLEPDFNLLEEITKSIPILEAPVAVESIDDQPRIIEDVKVVGPALRALYNFLKKADPNELWGELYKTSTPDGNILWLCKEHWQEYQAKPLNLY